MLRAVKPRTLLLRAACAGSLLYVACDQEPAPEPPGAVPPAPLAPQQPIPPQAPPTEAPASTTLTPEAAPSAAAPKPTKTPATARARAARASAHPSEGLGPSDRNASPSAPAASADPISAASAEAPKAPAPAAPAPVQPAATPAKKVVVPSTDNVRVEVPRGLQSLLDADARMQPWINRVIAVIDRCFASERARSPDAAGTVEIALTMHANARPEADIRSVPPQLGGVVACATPELMRARPPLFTGPEGERHTVRVRFTR
jgi:hypothetical protein